MFQVQRLWRGGWRSMYGVLLVAVIAVLNMGVNCDGDSDHGTAKQTLSLVQFDFHAQDGDYNLNWPGPPRRRALWSDVELYVPDLTTNQNPINDFTLCFDIKEDRSYWFDIELGFFCATWTHGTSTPVSFNYVSQGPDATDVPDGAPASINNGFWLVCTKLGKVKGNDGKGDDGHANVYLQMFDVISASEIAFSGSSESGRRTVKCI